MLTVDKLREFGADVDEGLGRCMNNEAFYLKLVDKALGTLDIAGLRESVLAGDHKRAFEITHAMKGVLGNLSLTPMFEIASDMTELLRAGKDADYTPYVDRLEALARRLSELSGEE